MSASHPDGPGAADATSEGVAAVARLSGAPVIPCAYSARRRRLLSSWDRFVVALPFTKGVFVWGEPIHVGAEARGAALDAARLKIETELTRVTREADRQLAGTTRTPSLPADPGDRRSGMSGGGFTYGVYRAASAAAGAVAARLSETGAAAAREIPRRLGANASAGRRWRGPRAS